MVELTNQNDVYNGGSGTDIVNGGNGADVLNGGDGADQLSGGNGNDTLNGGTGDDILNGDNGDDTLDGGEGVDEVYGGKGNDRLVYITQENAQANDLYDGGQGTDTLVIDLNNMTLPQGYADSAALKQAITDYFNGHLGQTMDFSSFGIKLTATNLENLVIVGDAVIPPPAHNDLFRAWIDTDNNHTYDANTDILIAKIEDTNDSGIIDIGDHAFLNVYPTSIADPTTNTGEILAPGIDEFELINAFSSSAQFTVVWVGGRMSGTDFTGIENLNIFFNGGSLLTMNDSTTNTINAAAPSYSIPVFVSNNDPGNQTFLDVEFLI